jgi:hypothetical protein
MQHARSAALAFALALASGCCDSASLGTFCPVPAAPDGGVRVVSPALECHSKLCLAPTGLCTVECSADEDCGMVYLDCRSGTVCARVPPYPRAVCTCR